MTQLREIYKCNVCGNVVEVVFNSAGELVCCNQNMEKLQAKTSDQGLEKHVPVIEETKDGVKVKVGSAEHPMEPDHFIRFIEILTANKVGRAELKPGEKPVHEFKIKKSEILEVREYCNKHGLWTSKK